MSIKTVLQCDSCGITDLDTLIDYHIQRLRGPDKDMLHLCKECGEVLIENLTLLGFHVEVVPLEKCQGRLFPAIIVVEDGSDNT